MCSCATLQVDAVDELTGLEDEDTFTHGLNRIRGKAAI